VVLILQKQRKIGFLSHTRIPVESVKGVGLKATPFFYCTSVKPIAGELLLSSAHFLFNFTPPIYKLFFNFPPTIFGIITDK
jgi:hypothetical protein